MMYAVHCTGMVEGLHVAECGEGGVPLLLHPVGPAPQPRQEGGQGHGARPWPQAEQGQRQKGQLPAAKIPHERLQTTEKVQ